jgi:ATP-dependent DNA helicase RecG
MSNKVNPMIIGDVDRLSKLNTMLAEGGIKTLSDEQFVEKMQDEGVRQKTYDFLVDSGIDVGDYTKFLNDFGFVSTPEQEHILPQAKMPSYEEFKENTIRHSVDGRLADSSELLKRTTTNDWADAQINKPLVDVVQQERDAVLRPSENVLDNIFESGKQYNEQKEAAKKAQSNYTAGAGAIKTPQMDTASKISYIGEDEYKYLKGQRNISISNIEDVIADAKKLYEEEKAQGNVKNIGTRAGRTDVALTKSAERVQNLITHLEDLRKKYTNMVTEADKKFGAEGDLGKGLAEFDLLDFLTAGWKGVLEGVDKYAVAKKISNGEKLTPEEQLYAKMFEEQARLEGLVEAQGDGKRRAYTLSAKVYRQQNNTVGYVRQTGIDAILYDELVLKLARQQGEVRRADVSQLLNISPSQAYRLLKRLALEEKLTLVGEGRGAHYEIL